MARPRNPGRQGWPPGLNRRVNKLSGDVYYTWTNPLTGEERSLKCTNDFVLAVSRAKKANALIAYQIEERAMKGLLAKKTTFEQWAAKYLEIIEARKLRPNTMKSRKSHVKKWSSYIGNAFLESVDTKTLSEVIDEEVNGGRARQAQAMLSTVKDIFNVAKTKGEFPSSYPNPADAIQPPAVKVLRSRLQLEEFNAILPHAKFTWERNACLLALVSGQGREDISLAQFRRGGDWQGLWESYLDDDSKPMPYSYIDGDTYYATRQKTGALIEIPMSLRLDAVGLSLGEVVSQCRKSGAASRYLIHHDVNRSTCAVGDPVWMDTLSRAFTRMRDRSGLSWRGDPPTFHEIRSLSERLYRAQGVNTQLLLGHTDQKMTDVYNDERRPKWKRVGE